MNGIKEYVKTLLYKDETEHEEGLMDTKEIVIRRAIADDINAIAEIEDKCFPAAEAASIKSFVERFIVFPECFFVAEIDGKVVGHINGCVTDAPILPDALYHNATLHQPSGAWQTVFGIAVRPEYQHQGIGGKLMKHLIADAKRRNKKGIVLTCKDEKIGFYESFGFQCRGVSESSHGNARWNDMVLTFS